MEYQVRDGARCVWWYHFRLCICGRIGVQVHGAGNCLHPDEKRCKSSPFSEARCLTLLTLDVESLRWIHDRQCGTGCVIGPRVFIMMLIRIRCCCSVTRKAAFLCWVCYSSLVASLDASRHSLWPFCTQLAKFYIPFGL